MGAFDDLPSLSTDPAAKPRRGAFDDLPLAGTPAPAAAVVPVPAVEEPPGAGLVDSIKSLLFRAAPKPVVTEIPDGVKVPQADAEAFLTQNAREAARQAATVRGPITAAGAPAVLQQPLVEPQRAIAEATKPGLSPMGGGTTEEAILSMPGRAYNSITKAGAGATRLFSEAAADFGVPGATELGRHARETALRLDRDSQRTALRFAEGSAAGRRPRPAENIPAWLLAPENISNLGEQLPQLAGVGASLLGAPAGAVLLGTIGLPVAGQAYHDYREKGYEGPVALLGALGQAGSEYLPEKYWVKFARSVKMGDLRGLRQMSKEDQRDAVIGLLKGYGVAGSSEMGAELASQVGNELVDLAMRDPDQTLDSVKDNFLNTIRQSALMLPVMGGAAHAGQAIARRVAESPGNRASVLARELEAAVAGTDLGGDVSSFGSISTQAPVRSSGMETPERTPVQAEPIVPRETSLPSSPATGEVLPLKETALQNAARMENGHQEAKPFNKALDAIAEKVGDRDLAFDILHDMASKRVKSQVVDRGEVPTGATQITDEGPSRSVVNWELEDLYKEITDGKLDDAIKRARAQTGGNIAASVAPQQGFLIRGQPIGEMTVRQLQDIVADPRTQFPDWQREVAKELKARERKGETFNGKTVDQLPDFALPIVEKKGRTAALRQSAAAERVRREGTIVALQGKLRDPATRKTLTGLAAEAGWAQRGGLMIRGAAAARSLNQHERHAGLGQAGGEVAGRTKWIPRAEWWPSRPVAASEDYYQKAVKDALAGEKLTSKQRDVVDFLVGLAQDENSGLDVPHETTQSDTSAAQTASDMAGQAPDGWRTMTEDEKNAELDAIFGPSEGAENDALAEAARPQADAAPLELGNREPGSDDELGTVARQRATPYGRERADLTNQEGGRRAVTDTPAFKAWFGESKVVDEKGAPLVVYHGTRGEFDVFRSGVKEDGGIFFSPDPNVAEAYAGYDLNFPAQKLGSVMPVYLRIENLKTVDFRGDKYGRPEAIAQAKKEGYDGLLLRNHYDARGVQDQYVVFDASQVKSQFNRGTFDPNKRSILEMPKRAYNPRQAELVYDDIETRPGTTPEQKALGVAALKSLFYRDRRAGASLLGSALWKGFTERGGAELIGQQVESHQDLARLAQILRDPRFETLRFFFTKGGEIVGHTGLTSRLPGVVAFVNSVSNFAMNERIAELKQVMNNLGADGYWMLHNHPSGRSIPSGADNVITKNIAAKLPGFKGHVVIDRGEYSHIDVAGSPSTFKMIGAGSVSEHELPHPLLGRTLSGPMDVVEIAKQLQAKSGYATMISTNGAGRVMAIAEIPDSLLKEDNKADKAKAIARVRHFERMTGAMQTFIVADDPFSHGFLIRNGVVVDVVESATAGGGRQRSLAEMGVDKQINRKHYARSMSAQQPPPPYRPAQQQAQPVGWQADQPGAWDAFVREWQNKVIDLKRVEAAIEKSAGLLPTANAPYLTEELSHGRVSQRTQEFEKKELEPMLRAIKAEGLTAAEVGDYLWARHAPERNAQMDKINPGSGGNLSGLTNAEAAQKITGYRTAGKLTGLNRIASMVDAVTHGTQQLMLREGLVDQQILGAWNGAYKHYVPLFRDQDDAPGTGVGFKISGPESKRAMGSERGAVDILAAVAWGRERAIIRAEKARVGRDLIKLAEAHPNADFWRVDSPPMKRRLNPHTGLVEHTIDPLYRNRPDVFIVKEKGPTGEIVERTLTFNEHNERALRLSHSMQNLDAVQLGAITKIVGKFSRFLANLATQWNPVFWATNFARDIQTAGVNLGSTKLRGQEGRVISRIPAALAGIADAEFRNGNSHWAKLYREYEAAGGKTGWVNLFEDLEERQKELEKMIDAGGRSKVDPRVWANWSADIISKTNTVIENSTRLAAYAVARDRGLTERESASLAKNLTVNFNRKGNRSSAASAWYMFFNANAQGTARMISGLKTSHKAQAIVGMMTALGAALELINRMIGDRDRDEAGNNPYELIADWEKQRNWIVMKPGKKDKGEVGYWKVPLPYGFNIFPAVGRVAMEAVLGAQKSKLVTHKRDAMDLAGDLANVVIDAFGPLGQTATAIQTIAPTVADPFVQVAENRKFSGAPMVPERQAFNKQLPNSELYFNSDNEAAKDLARWLNRISGGNDIKRGSIDIYPGHIQHVVQTLTGGPGTFGMGMFDWGKNLTERAMGKDVEPISASRIPFVGKFYGEVDERSIEARFYKLKKDADRVFGEMTASKKAGDAEAVEAIERESPALVEFAREAAKKDFRKQRKDLNDEMRSTRDLPLTDRATAKRNIKREQSQLYLRALEAYNEAVQENRE